MTPDDPRQAEAELIAQARPTFNVMGADASEASGLNPLVKAQLQAVRDELEHYLPTKPRGWGDDEQMPHQWGSLDSYDDMRASLKFAAGLMDALMDPPPDDLPERLREIVVESGASILGVADDVLKVMGFDGGEGDDEAHAKFEATQERLG